jgi:hypothetical protein
MIVCPEELKCDLLNVLLFWEENCKNVIDVTFIQIHLIE